MKGLVIDSSVSKMTVAVKNDEKTVSAVYDIGMKQSETIVCAVDYVMEKCGLLPENLDYTAMCIGPGSFTGLRLSVSVLKALTLSFNVPLYGFSTLEVYEFPYKNSGSSVLTCIDAKKDRFYARIIDSKNNLILDDGDYEVKEILSSIKKIKNQILICGPSSKELKNILDLQFSENSLLTFEIQPSPENALFKMAEESILCKKPCMKDYDAPLYLRASEAEVKLGQ